MKVTFQIAKVWRAYHNEVLFFYACVSFPWDQQCLKASFVAASNMQQPKSSTKLKRGSHLYHQVWYKQVFTSVGVWALKTWFCLHWDSFASCALESWLHLTPSGMWQSIHYREGSGSRQQTCSCWAGLAHVSSAPKLITAQILADRWKILSETSLKQ